MYSKRVRFTASIAGLCIFAAIKLGVMAALNFFTSGGGGDHLFASLSCFGAGLIVAGIAMYYARIERREEQKFRDRSAQSLAEEAERRATGILSGTDTSPFVLYLRPFALEKAIREWKVGATYSKTFFLVEGGRENFDYLLLDQLNHLDMPLVSIGCPKNQEGAGHVVATDLSWRERFHQLAERATTVVVVPGIQAGIKAEIRWLRVAGLLVKTVFFKPAGYPKEEWKRISKFYEEEDDMQLPDYSSKQLSFRMYSSGKYHELLTWRTVYRKNTRKRGADQMRTILSNQPVGDI